MTHWEISLFDLCAYFSNSDIICFDRLFRFSNPSILLIIGLLLNSLLGFWILKEWLIGELFYYLLMNNKVYRCISCFNGCFLLWHSETLPVEYLGGKPLCMDQYYQVLTSCRIPGPKRDAVMNYAIGKTAPTHITVVHNFQVYFTVLFFSISAILKINKISKHLKGFVYIFYMSFQFWPFILFSNDYYSII